MRQVAYTLIIFALLLIGFNGYLDPHQIRSFGDISPNTNILDGDDFEFYNINFLEIFQPNFYAPYRYQLENGIEHIAKQGVSKYTIDWLTLFLPFLISLFLASYFFRSISGNDILGVFVWSVYSFSTFILFTSSIHTPIITAINLTLFFLFLWKWYINAPHQICNTLLYIFSSVVVLTIASIFELRMLIVSAPFFFAAFIAILLTRPYRWQDMRRYLLVHGAILALVVANFYFIIANIRNIFGTVSLGTSRSTWGSEYFNIINTLSLSHPFWNNTEAVNFIYNPPQFINTLYLIGTGLTIYILFKNKSVFYRNVVLLGSLLFFLFLSKQNAAPFEYLYEQLYRMPYFSFSREASKYYYGYLLSLLVLLAVALRLHAVNGRVKTIKNIALGALTILCFLLPTINNFYVFSTGKYGNSTQAYKYETLVYEKINHLVLSDTESQTNEIRILWLPLLGTLQDNTARVRHMSYSVIRSIYPLDDIRKEDRSYLHESLSDENMLKYLQIMGFAYIVIPNFNNEPSIASQMQLQYASFDYDTFVNYAERTLPIRKIDNIDGYLVYKVESSPLSPIIIDSYVNSRYGNIGEIELSGTQYTNLPPTTTQVPFNYQSSNCNANQALGLDFLPEQRIRILPNQDTVEIHMEANYNEIPCVFITIKSELQSQLFLLVESSNGSPLDLVTFSDSFPNKITSIKAQTIRDGVRGHVPLFCQKTHCTFALYLQGKDPIGLQKNSISLSIDSQQKESGVIESNLVEPVPFPINSLQTTKIPVTQEMSRAKFLLFPYSFDESYELSYQGNTVKPLKNNHNLLLFRITEGSHLGANLELKYLKEDYIRKDLIVTNWINIITLFLLIPTIIFWLYCRRKSPLIS